MMSVALIAAGVNFASDFLNGISERKAYGQRAREYEQQAEQLRRNAQKVRLEGSLTEDAMRRENRLKIAEFAAASGENGMGESPTTAAVVGSKGGMLEQNVLNERYRYQTEAENYLFQSRLAEQNARAMRKKKKHAFNKSFIQATGTALAAF